LTHNLQEEKEEEEGAATTSARQAKFFPLPSFFLPTALRIGNKDKKTRTQTTPISYPKHEETTPIPHPKHHKQCLNFLLVQENS
jgi:hypothetical protein